MKKEVIIQKLLYVNRLNNNILKTYDKHTYVWVSGVYSVLCLKVLHFVIFWINPNKWDLQRNIQSSKLTIETLEQGLRYVSFWYNKNGTFISNFTPMWNHLKWHFRPLRVPFCLPIILIRKVIYGISFEVEEEDQRGTHLLSVAEVHSEFNQAFKTNVFPKIVNC